MILFEQVTHYVKLTKPILRNVNVVLPADKRLAVFGNAQSGKTTLARIVSGLVTPRMGLIVRRCRVSYPVGPATDTTPKASVRHNLQDYARLYGIKERDLIDFVVSAGDAEMLLHRPLGKLSSAEKARVFYPLIYALPFDYYVLDGAPGGPVQAYRERFEALFKHRVRDQGLIMMTNKPKIAKQYCDAGAILHNGKLVLYQSLEEAAKIYEDHILPLETEGEAAPPKALPAPKKMAELSEAPPQGIFI
ncbi:MAG: ATP-binding cassette domain-containing protein [Pseudomonadota bacterium]